MAGLLEMIDPELAKSPFFQTLGRNKNALSGMILGGVGAPHPMQGVRGMAQGLQAGGQMDDARNMLSDQQEEERQRRNETVEWATRQFPQLAGAPPELVTPLALKLWDQSMTGGQAPDPTSAMQNYEFLVGQGLSPEDALGRVFSGGTTVNVGQSEYGTIPAGYELTTDPETGARRMQAIPGGPAALEAQQVADQAETRDEIRERAGNVVIHDIDRALEIIGNNEWNTTGLVGGASQGVPGLPAHDVQSLITTVQGNVGFDKLQQLRDASPTGGALGQVSTFELQQLNAAIGNLSLSQSADQLKDNLKRVKNIYLDIIHGSGNGPAREPLGFEGGSSAPGGYTVISVE